MEKTQCASWRDGWNAHMNGVDVLENPYDEKRQAVSHTRWLNGWCARFGAIKRGTCTRTDDMRFNPYGD